MKHAESETRFAVLLFTDIVGSADLKVRHGIPVYSAALDLHNGHFEKIARECRGIRIMQNMGDGYFAEADSVTEAVRFGLLFQDAMRTGPWGEICLTARFGIHAGEVAALIAEGGSGIVAPAADLAARVMSLAVGGQILLTRFPFDEARHFLREHPAVASRDTPPLRWLAHGPYLLKGREDPLEIFEVGAEGLSPLTPPPDGEKARRAIRPGEEETLGWRPAIGLVIPGRPGWRLTGKLGAGGFGEVWIGEHAKLRQRRAFKFCFDDERLRALKREVTLVRLLRTALGDRDDIVRLHELKLDEPPFYLESDLAPHGNLLQWAEKQGGLAAIPLAQRIALVAHTATALAAAHSIGVLHKDIKPTNILIFDAPDGTARPRLVDFGIGTLADPTVLGRHGVTAAGFTRSSMKHSTGTPTYSPPEYLAGKPYTMQGDIYGLGVLLYQLIAIKPIDPLAAGWERDITDPLLREDIAACVDGDPARRLPSAADLSDRLRNLKQRGNEIAERERLAGEAAARAEAEARELTERERRKQIEEHNLQLRSLLAEAARSDRLVAEERLVDGKGKQAFAHLARACEYDPHTTLAAEKAVAALNRWDHPVPLTVFSGHEGLVLNARFSPDGTRVVTASDDQTARVWDAATGTALAMLTGHEGRVWSAQYSPDGKRIVTASRDKTARLWDAATGKTLATLVGHEGGIRGAQFSLDGTHIVTASEDKTARVWDAATGKSLATLAGHKGELSSAHYSPAGRRIVTASDDQTARVWDATTWKMLGTLAGHEGRVWGAQFSLDGTHIVTASEDKTARVWDATTGKMLATLAGHEAGVTSAQFSPDGTRILTASRDKTARVWDVATGETLATLAGHEHWVWSAQYSPDGMRIVTASRDKTARVWAAAASKPLATLAGHEEGMRSAQFSPDGARIVTASDDQTARVWSVATGKMVATLAGHEAGVTSAQFSPAGTHIVTASYDTTVRVWDATTGKTVATLAGHEGGMRSAQYNPAGTHIVTASDDQTARVWDAATGKTLATLAGHEGRVLSAQFSPDGTRIVTASRDKTARVWDVATGKTLATLAGHEEEMRSAQFGPDGTRIVTASEDMTARLWDAATGKTLATLAGHKGELNSAQFSPDGTRIITASEDRMARLWDAATGKPLATLAGHEEGMRSAQFSLDGTRIVTASSDKTACVWHMLPPSAGPPPEWFPDFLRYMAQMRLNSAGELETLKSSDWLALRERLRSVLRASAGQDTPYLLVLRKYVRE